MCEHVFGWTHDKAETVTGSTDAVLPSLAKLGAQVAPEYSERVTAWAAGLRRLVKQRGRWVHAAVVSVSCNDSGRADAWAIIHGRTGERPYVPDEAAQLLVDLRSALVEANWIIVHLLDLADSLRTSEASE